MDKETIEAYNREAEGVAKLHSTLIPHRIYSLIDQYFIKSGSTVDIGCGIGRDTHWLNQHGFPTIGVDASVKMLETARGLYPTEIFVQDYLPNLNKLKDLCFHNILCSAVLMHLNKRKLQASCNKLLLHLNEGGCLIVSFRGTSTINHREAGKLYEPINSDEFISNFKNSGCIIVFNETNIETARNLTWNNFVIIKN